MIDLIPEAKVLAGKGGARGGFSRVAFEAEGWGGAPGMPPLEKLLAARLRDLPALAWSVGGGAERPAAAPPARAPGSGLLRVRFRHGLGGAALPAGAEGQRLDRDALRRAGYSLELEDGRCTIGYSTAESAVDALATLKQLITRRGERFEAPAVAVLDWPEVAVRSLSTTFAWYAGYGRIGFDSQLWGLEEWKRFLDTCADYKINQLNMCMYGYWPFEFPEYPDTVLRDIPMKVWNAESGRYVDMLYSHPNVAREFLSELIGYAHLLSIRIFAYIGLNSYNGGFSNLHREKRMKLPEGSRFVNDFDSLCLSDPGNIEYLKACMRRIVRLGLDRIVFEESEEAYWFCDCPDCRRQYGERTPSPAEAKHEANYRLLAMLHAVIKEENPSCEVGLRAWREPPLEKTVAYLEHCRDSIPPDVCLYWAPGLYVPEAEFGKWVEVFGRERICARDTESNAWSSTQGRLIRIFKSNVLRSGEETNAQFIEKDIEQHRGSVAHRVRGINGYLFEWYGYFLHLLAHAHYGWGSRMAEDAFCERAARRFAGDEVAGDVLHVLRNILTIHESQIRLFPAEFPFLRNNVGSKDVPAIEAARAEWPDIDAKLARVIAHCEAREECREQARHFRKIRNAHQRNRHIYALCLAAVAYDNEATEEGRRRLLREIEEHNERDFALVKSMFLDTWPVDRTGVKSCMYPYHELKRVLDNALGRNLPPDEQMIYLGVEALGWLWI